MTLSTIAQIALSVSSADLAESFYRDRLGLKHLYRVGDLVFFDCGGIRLMLDANPQRAAGGSDGCIYFRVADIEAVYVQLSARGVSFEGRPHLVAKMPDHELWIARFRDPDQHLWAIMEEKR